MIKLFTILHLSIFNCVFCYRLIPILVNGMKYSEIDIIILKVRTKTSISLLLSAHRHMLKLWLFFHNQCRAASQTVDKKRKS